jgi:hypothetical protein
MRIEKLALVQLYRIQVTLLLTVAITTFFIMFVKNIVTRKKSPNLFTNTGTYSLRLVCVPKNPAQKPYNVSQNSLLERFNT